MYDTIVNPLTNHKVSIHTRLGKSILKKYEKEFYKNQQGGEVDGFTKDADVALDFVSRYNASIDSKDSKDSKDSIFVRAGSTIKSSLNKATCIKGTEGKHLEHPNCKIPHIIATMGRAYDPKNHTRKDTEESTIKHSRCLLTHGEKDLRYSDLTNVVVKIGCIPFIKNDDKTISSMKNLQEMSGILNNKNRDKIKDIYHNCWKPYARLYQLNSISEKLPDHIEKYRDALKNYLNKCAIKDNFNNIDDKLEKLTVSDTSSRALDLPEDTRSIDFEYYKDHIFPRACCYSKPESWDVLTGNSSEISNKVEEEFKTLVANGKILVPAENPVKIIKEVFSNAMSKILDDEGRTLLLEINQLYDSRQITAEVHFNLTEETIGVDQIDLKDIAHDRVIFTLTPHYNYILPEKQYHLYSDSDSEVLFALKKHIKISYEILNLDDESDDSEIMKSLISKDKRNAKEIVKLVNNVRNKYGDRFNEDIWKDWWIMGFEHACHVQHDEQDLNATKIIEDAINEVGTNAVNDILKNKASTIIERAEQIAQGMASSAEDIIRKLGNNVRKEFINAKRLLNSATVKEGALHLGKNITPIAFKAAATAAATAAAASPVGIITSTVAKIATARFKNKLKRGTEILKESILKEYEECATRAHSAGYNYAMDFCFRDDPAFAANNIQEKIGAIQSILNGNQVKKILAEEDNQERERLIQLIKDNLDKCWKERNCIVVDDDEDGAEAVV